MRPDGKVDMIHNCAGLRANGPAFGIDLENLVEVHREVDHERFTNCLPGERRATASWQHGYAVLRGKADGFHYILFSPRDQYGDRSDLVQARVGAVEGARHVVRAEVALDPDPE